MADSLTVRVHIDGLRETLAALRNLPKDANNELREAATALAKEMATAAAASGRSQGRQAMLVAATVRAARDRVPVVVAGGTKRIGSRRKPAFKLLFGSEFGSNRLRQYKPHLGSGSYWFFRTIEDEQVEISARWQKAADEIIAKFGGI
jgi:inorganic triphosphatase YgiF